MIRILGTSHVSKDSINSINAAFKERIPEIVAVELDSQRLYALQNNIKSSRSPNLIRQIGLAGYLFVLIGSWIQGKFGRFVGMNPGSEMLHAVKLASENNVPVALIDRPLVITMKRFSKKFTFREKLRLFRDMIIPRRQKFSLDIRKVPEDKLILEVMQMFKKSYPSLYAVLVSERDEYMARNLAALASKDVLAVVGAGHVPGILEALTKAKAI
ncbi:MAG: TraB/GumN family protein [Candidatus Woesearchaeota archaeon]